MVPYGIVPRPVNPDGETCEFAIAIDDAFQGRRLGTQLMQAIIEAARAKGLAQRGVTYKHALRPAIIPFVAGIGGLLPDLVGGAGLVEVTMSWPGITPTFLEALNSQDIYVVLGLLVITTILLMIGNLLSDLLLAAVDPRIRYN